MLTAARGPVPTAGVRGWPRRAVENSDRRGFNQNDGSGQPRGCDSGPISHSLPLALDKLHGGDTRLIAWLPFGGAMTYNKPLKP